MNFINKDTLIFGSFAKVAGNNGCRMFNSAFKQYNINAIYKSFSINNIQKAIEAARILDFKGFAVTMPFKKEALNYVDILTDTVSQIGALNTVINTNGILMAWNTDYTAAQIFLSKLNLKHLYILGDGGYAAAVKHASETLNISYHIINRSNWNDINDIKDSVIYNCTPVSDIVIDESNKFIDCLITTDTGKYLSQLQAAYQFGLYTKNLYDYEEIINTFSKCG